MKELDAAKNATPVTDGGEEKMQKLREFARGCKKLQKVARNCKQVQEIADNYKNLQKQRNQQQMQVAYSKYLQDYSKFLDL